MAGRRGQAGSGGGREGRRHLENMERLKLNVGPRITQHHHNQAQVVTVGNVLHHDSSVVPVQQYLTQQLQPGTAQVQRVGDEQPPHGSEVAGGGQYLQGLPARNIV